MEKKGNEDGGFKDVCWDAIFVKRGGRIADCCVEEVVVVEGSRGNIEEGEVGMEE